jgi:hypothetical protein
MPKLEPLTLKAEAGTIPISEANFLAYIHPELTDCRGDLSTLGCWQIPVTFKAPAVSYTWGEYGFMETITLYGSRSMGRLKQSGYHLEGQTSIKGKKVSAFTSSQLWQLPDSRLFETATIHCRMGKKP